MRVELTGRHLAIVRRASNRPSRCRILTIFESDSGFFGSSASMILRMRCLIVTDETLSPYELLIPLWKKYFISNTPCGVCMYLLLTTRLTVDSCIPMSLATSRSTRGFRYSMPWSRKSRWKLMMLLATL